MFINKCSAITLFIISSSKAEELSTQRALHSEEVLRLKSFSGSFQKSMQYKRSSSLLSLCDIQQFCKDSWFNSA